MVEVLTMKKSREIDKILTFLKSSRIFGGLSEKDLKRIAGVAFIEKKRKNQILFSDGQKAEKFYFLLNGKVKIFKIGYRGRQQILRFILPGESFAEAAMFGGEEYPASAVTVANSELIAFPRDRFLHVVAGNPEIAMRLLGSFAKFLRYLVDLIDSVCLRTVPSRLATYILTLSGGQDFKPGVTINIGMSKGELSEKLGIAQETLSRTFKKFKERGIIELKGREVKVLNPQRLKEISTGKV